MTTSVKRSLPLVALVLFCFRSGFASPPSGSFTLSFSSPTSVLYDLTGIYDIDQQIQGADDSTVDLSLVGLQIEQDGQGRLRAPNGAGLILVTIGPQDAVAADYTASGRVSGGGSSPTRVHLQVKLRGNDIVAGLPTGFNISITYDLEVTDGVLTGTARGNANFSKLSGGTINSPVSIPLPDGMDGTWALTLDVVPLNKLGGSGTVVLSNGRVLQGRINGDYSLNQARSKIRLKGSLDQRITPPSVAVPLSGNHLDVIIPDDPDLSVEINGKLLGQSVME
ncbi:MAG: hypothetical protein C5B50_27685 [Verrucomicrobia bacterium]|nr:MAG: hypothetical protein C5B50_27685 [Verrucomicrobiota bacterium]